ncbi:transcriptional repressor, CopY family [Syntrophobotulus glycolicus DSM 8271]|uniref:Transcriptional repressor, CopY family n=1 Tax=Syntrophobotulus glycolicus (strain DSM 8271 / FlGlyR) TaxID=645991 RepID=F0STY6_SYNGF|nr:BlaI/MecI/CopY family transcriptional regulator [Syntrophobotulus glycolicus]ADY56509.1 transcriptional repressor, CopY family [Syntrophobotulus glycolicus DSM 8271]
MSKIQRMSDSEKQIAEIMWAVGHPITTKEIIANLPETNTWKQNTVITFLARLIEKGIVSATRVSKANYYQPTVTEQEYLNFETQQFIADVHKGSALGIISALCDSGDLTKEDIEELIRKLRK